MVKRTRFCPKYRKYTIKKTFIFILDISLGIHVSLGVVYMDNDDDIHINIYIVTGGTIFRFFLHFFCVLYVF